VTTRSDRGNRLLHSKYLVIDHELVVIGSHNWSKGSYFDFDDLSLVIQSGELAAALETRFDTLWATGS
jgi:phosphatidylserine/phosphatidylglycerophosphate/cardiolipin synthase-like enzyme